VIETAIIFGALAIVALFAWGALRHEPDHVLNEKLPPESILNRMWKGERHD